MDKNKNQRLQSFPNVTANKLTLFKPELSGMGAKLGTESYGKNISLKAFNRGARGTFGPKEGQ